MPDLLFPVLFAQNGTLAALAGRFTFSDFLLNFISVVLEALPFIVFGAVLSGLLEEFLPQRFFQRFLPSWRPLAIATSSFLGLLLPMCECGIVAVMRRLLKKGVPASCAVTYMLSAPVINPIVLWSTVMAFSYPSFRVAGVDGLGMALLRGGTAFVVAVTVGLLIDRLSRRGVAITADAGGGRTRIMESAESRRLDAEDAPAAAPRGVAVPGLVVMGNEPAAPAHDHGPGHVHGPDCDHDHHDHAHDHGHDHHHHGHDHTHGPAGRTPLQRAFGVAEIAVADFLDIAAFLVLGAALAATVRTVVTVEEIGALGAYPIPSIAGMMGLAALLALCSEADAFVAANLVGIPTAAKLAFMVLGPMLDVKLFIMYRWVFSRPALRLLVTSVILLVFFLCLGVHLAAPNLGQELVAPGSAAALPPTSPPAPSK